MTSATMQEPLAIGWRRAGMRCASAAATLAIASTGILRSGMAFDAGLTLLVFVAMMIGWIVLKLPQTPLAVAGALLLAACSVVDESDLFEALGSEIVWVMIAAFLIAAVLARTGLAERLSLAALSRTTSVRSLFWTATAVIAATAFVIPSTSARAAILLPVFGAMAAVMPARPVVRALGLLFPTIILLSAAASLTGAGAHLVAAELVDQVADRDIGYVEWVLFGLPVAALTSAIACGLILRLFLDPATRASIIKMPDAPLRLRGREWVILACAVVIVGLFATGSWHGLSLGVVGMAGALVISSKALSGLGFKAALKEVDWDLLIFLAATLCVGEALVESGAAGHLIDYGVSFALHGSAGAWMIVAFVAATSALAHLVIISRTARATVLIPVLAVPLSSMGVEPHILIMVTAIGSGFCQTFAVSAKPVMLFAGGDDPPFSDRDLLRLAAWLFVPFVSAVTIAALWLWPFIRVSD